MRTARTWFSWWASLLSLWILFTGTIDWQELVAGACAAGIGATGQVVARRTCIRVFRVDLDRERQLALVHELDSKYARETPLCELWRGSACPDCRGGLLKSSALVICATIVSSRGLISRLRRRAFFFALLKVRP